MTAIVKSNVAYTGPNLGALDAVTRTAADLYTTYAARVTADGGTIGDAAATLAAITSALAGGYYDGIATAVSARWGRKLSGSAIVKLYSLASGVDGVAFNTVDLDTSLTTPYNNRIKLDATADSIDFASIIMSTNGQHGYVAVEDVIGASGIGYQQFTTAGHYRDVRQNLATGQGFGISTDTTSTNRASILTGSPDFSAAARDAIHWFMDEDAVEVDLGLNGVWRKLATGFTAMGDGQVVTMSYKRLSGTAAYLHELWAFNNITKAQVAQCAYDRGAIY